MSGPRNVRHVETGLSTNAKLIEAWVQDFPDDPNTLILTGAAIRVERIPDLIAALEEIHRIETDPGTKA
jgi:hypothetical protein